MISILIILLLFLQSVGLATSATTSPTPSPSHVRSTKNNIVLVAGTGPATSTGTGGKASSATFNTPRGVWIDSMGTFYAAELTCARKFDLSSTILSGFLGICGTATSTGDGGAATSATVVFLVAGVADTTGRYYVNDYSSNKVKMVTTSGIVTSIAGSSGLGTNTGDNGAVTASTVKGPDGMWINSLGDVFIASFTGHCIRKITVSTQIITTVAGTGTSGSTGVGGQATSALLQSVEKVLVDTSGVIYISDAGNLVLKQVATSGIISILIGNGATGYAGENTAGTSTQITYPTGMSTDSSNGDIYFVDRSVPRVRVLGRTTGLVSTVAGTGTTGTTGDDGPATAALVSTDQIFTDTSGNLYLAEYTGHKYRYVFSVEPTYSPTVLPSLTPSVLPTVSPSVKPSVIPSVVPTLVPTVQPSRQPSVIPSQPPSVSPSLLPTQLPTCLPTVTPTAAPSILPTVAPSVVPTVSPSICPSAPPSLPPSLVPSAPPTLLPSLDPTLLPTLSPSVVPSVCPSFVPSLLPSCSPSLLPSVSPSMSPSVIPTISPSISPSISPTVSPTIVPTITPTLVPTTIPTVTPTISPTTVPSAAPSTVPSLQPSVAPTPTPSVEPSLLPSLSPSVSPSLLPSITPSVSPSLGPTLTPSVSPSVSPSILPSLSPTCCPSFIPSIAPSVGPSVLPSICPSLSPSLGPSCSPTCLPSVCPSLLPSIVPSVYPSLIPSLSPSIRPSVSPSVSPSVFPTLSPSLKPTLTPTLSPSIRPSVSPSFSPSVSPSLRPTLSPTPLPTVLPSLRPSFVPSVSPTSTLPTLSPSLSPSVTPSIVPSFQPSLLPSVLPTTLRPSFSPSILPSVRPSALPSLCPSAFPSLLPSLAPSVPPTEPPSESPTAHPSLPPSALPSVSPSLRPSVPPSLLPSFSPSFRPSSRSPSLRPSCLPSEIPNNLPFIPPTPLPSVQPSVYVPVATLPAWPEGSSSLSVLGSNDSFKIVLPFGSVNPVHEAAFSDIVSPSVGASDMFGSASGLFGRKDLNRSSLIDLTLNVYGQMFSWPYSLGIDVVQGRSASEIGDFNGDGFRDLIIGDPLLSRCYVLFGTSGGLVNMTRGFTVFGAQDFDWTGWSVSRAGDVNNDSYSDIIIGAPHFSSVNTSAVGAVYVLFGKETNKCFDVYLNNLNSSDGVAWYGSSDSEYVGVSVSGAGDVNKDGYDDIVVGAASVVTYYSGAVHTVYGDCCLQSGRSLSDLSSLSLGFTVEGAAFQFVGSSVSGAGDVNGDGYDDLLLGSTPVGLTVPPSSYVVFGGGTMSDSSLSDLVGKGKAVHLSGGGALVSGLSDINQDGYSDVMVMSKTLIGERNHTTPSGVGLFIRTSVHFVASPSIRPSLSPTVQPTKLVTRSPTTGRPSVKPTRYPTLSPSSSAPSVAATQRPSQPTETPTTSAADSPTIEPTIAPTSAPTPLPSEVPSEVPSEAPVRSSSPSESPSEPPSVSPTAAPSQAPSAVPTLPAHPTRLPRSYPSLLPSVQPSLPFDGVYEWVHVSESHLVRTSGNLNFIVNGSEHGNVTIGGTGGRDKFTILPCPNSLLTIEYFNLTSDLIDLTAFSQYSHLSDLTITSGSAVINLPHKQYVHILNLEPSELKSKHFLFAEVSTDDTFEHTTPLRRAQAYIIALGLLLVVCAACYAYVIRPYVKKKRREAALDQTVKVLKEKYTFSIRGLAMLSTLAALDDLSDDGSFGSDKDEFDPSAGHLDKREFIKNRFGGGAAGGDTRGGGSRRQSARNSFSIRNNRRDSERQQKKTVNPAVEEVDEEEQDFEEDQWGYNEYDDDWNEWGDEAYDHHLHHPAVDPEQLLYPHSGGFPPPPFYYYDEYDEELVDGEEGREEFGDEEYPMYEGEKEGEGEEEDHWNHMNQMYPVPFDPWYHHHPLYDDVPYFPLNDENDLEFSMPTTDKSNVP